MSKWALTAAMVTGEQLTVRGVTGRVMMVELEDGSGHCYNVRVLPSTGGDAVVVFVRTVD